VAERERWERFVPAIPVHGFVERQGQVRLELWTLVIHAFLALRQQIMLRLDPNRAGVDRSTRAGGHPAKTTTICLAGDRTR